MYRGWRHQSISGENLRGEKQRKMARHRGENLSIVAAASAKAAA